MNWRRIAGFRLVTADPQRLARFYAGIGFAVGDTARIEARDAARIGVSGGTRTAMRIGGTHVALDCFDDPGHPYPADANAAAACFQHLALVTDDAVAAWVKALAAGATPISQGGPATLPGSSGGVTAIKFRDPEGHPLEFLRFPDMATAGWPGRGVLGIDHSAMTVADADQAIAFYRDRGLAPGDATHNHGPAQAALDGLDDPDALVVPLMPTIRRPHVELLGYRRPRVAGEPPAATDIAATRILWEADTDGLCRDADGHWHETIVSR